MEAAAINELSIEKLEAIVAERKKEEKIKKEKERKAREIERKAYEKDKDVTVDDGFEEAFELANALARFKNKMHVVMEAKKKHLETYGSIRSSSKGGFSLIHSNGQRQIKRRRDTNPIWDERASKAIELLKDFLLDKVKKRDKKVFEMLMGFLEKNQAGDWEFSSAMQMISHEDLFDDPRWLEGIRLLKEGYSLGFKAFSYEFKQKDAHGKWKSLNLNFSSL